MLGVGGGVVETPRCSPSASRAPEPRKWDEGFGRSTGSLSGLSDQALGASQDHL